MSAGDVSNNVKHARQKPSPTLALFECPSQVHLDSAERLTLRFVYGHRPGEAERNLEPPSLDVAFQTLNDELNGRTQESFAVRELDQGPGLVFRKYRPVERDESSFVFPSVWRVHDVRYIVFLSSYVGDCNVALLCIVNADKLDDLA